MKIKRISAHQVFDSRANPTIEVVLDAEDGSCGRAIVPSGASTGEHEALELRDGDPARYRGRSVYHAIENVHAVIAPAVVGMEVENQSDLDQALRELDGTSNKSRLGANAILAVSMASAVAAANANRQPLFQWLGRGQGRQLPLPEVQIFGGGRHASGRIDVQDFMIVPLKARSFAEALETVFYVYHAAADVMASQGRLVGVADEGGYWPHFESNEQVLDTLLAAIEHAGFSPGNDVGVSLDIAASELFHEGEYHFVRENRRFASAAFAQLMKTWVEDYPIVSLEDPMAENDWDGWKLIRAQIGDRCQLIGDDLFTTNLTRIRRGIAERAANAVLIKLNQIGTVSETLQAIDLTQKNGWLPVISARSGESEDSFISHLAVATNAGQLKVGSLSRGERTAKWNEVLRIDRMLGKDARYAGAEIFSVAGISLRPPQRSKTNRKQP